MIPSGWTLTPLSEVLHHRKEFVTIDDLTSYKRCRVQLHSKGVVLRDQVQGVEIKTKTQQVCRTGEFLVAEIDAKVGGYGMVPPDLEGAVVSSHYFLFSVNEQKLDRRFLDYYIRTPDFADQVNAQGSTNYAAIRPYDVLSYTVPLPPLEDQRRVVTKIDQLVAKVAEAFGLRQSSLVAVEALSNSSLTGVMKGLTDEYGVVPLDRLIADAGYGTSAKCDHLQSNNSVPILRIPNVASEVVNLEDLKYAELSAREREKVNLSPNDLLVVRTNGSADLVGRSAVVGDLPTPTGFASYLIRIQIDEQQADVHFIQRVMRHLRTNGSLFDIARTTAGQYNVSLGRLRRALIPLPPIAVQLETTGYLDGLQSKSDRLKAVQFQTAAELAALLPSILDKAFKGDLVSAASPAIRLTQANESVEAVLMGEGLFDQPTHFIRRAAVDTYILDCLAGDPHLGRTKLEKINHLIEYHCGVDLGRDPIRDAAGPVDYPSRKKTESRAAKRKYYFTNQDPDNDRVTYSLGSSVTDALRRAGEAFSGKFEQVRQIVSFFRPLTTRQSEIIATLYGSWNDFLLLGTTPTDEQIIDDVLNNWHEKKKAIPLNDWRWGLGWLRLKELTPTGTGKSVRQKRQKSVT